MSIPRPSASLVVAALALVLATGTTSFAAGVAAGSVGTAQLRNGAVTTAKIRPGAVTGTQVRDRSLTGRDVRDRSLTGRDLAPGTVPRTVAVSRSTGPAPATQVAALAGLRFAFRCDTTLRLAELTVTPTAGRLDRTGNEVQRVGTTQYPRSIVHTSNTQATFGEALPADTSGTTTFDGTIQAAGAPLLRITVCVQWSPASSTPCTLRLALTP